MPPMTLRLCLLLALANPCAGSRLQQSDSETWGPARRFGGALAVAARRLGGATALPGAAQAFPPALPLASRWTQERWPAERWPQFSQGLQHHAALEKKACSYRDLEQAAFSAAGKQEVEMHFCGKWQQLRYYEQTEDMFAAVDWWEPGLQGQELSPKEKSFIVNYTGSYAFSRNVGTMLRGLAPYLDNEDDTSFWTEKRDRAKLAREVLDFTVGLATSLNKLPSPAAPKQLERGAWLSGSTVQQLLSKPQNLRLPWFQPATAYSPHSYFFLMDKFAPMGDDIDIGPMHDELSYPVHFTFNTSRAKDVTHWNAREHEHIILPNLPFNVVSAEKVVNDPIAYMTSRELSQWLNSQHALPEEHTERLGMFEAGPWPEAAAAVNFRKITGQEFAKSYRKGATEEVCDLLGIEWLLQSGLHEVLQAHFKLADKYPRQPSTFPFYFEVLLRDAEL